MISIVKRFYLQLKGLMTFRRSVVVFGNFTVVNSRNVRIGKNCAINHNVFILGGCGIEIGDCVILSTGCMLIDATLDPRTFSSVEARSYANKPIRIENGAWIGAGAIILPGVTVGERSIVGAGSVVTRSIPSASVAVGNPAKVIKRVADV